MNDLKLILANGLETTSEIHLQEHDPLIIVSGLKYDPQEDITEWDNALISPILICAAVACVTGNPYNVKIDERVKRHFKEV